MKVEQKINCMFSHWYNDFKNVTIESVVLDIPADVLSYLLSDDSLVLPFSDCPLVRATVDDEDESNDEETEWDDDAAGLVEPEFPEFDAEVKECIAKLGGKVLPKLNWSAPRDAAWVSFDRTLCCSSLRDILLLLKSSEFVTHDLVQPFAEWDAWEDGTANTSADKSEQADLSVTDVVGKDRASTSSRSSVLLESHIAPPCTKDVERCSSNAISSCSNSDNDCNSRSIGCNEVTSVLSHDRLLNRELDLGSTDRQQSHSDSDKAGQVTVANSKTIKYQLVLRRWRNISEMDEFRCFVSGNRLIGISQRYCSTHFPSLPSNMSTIARDIDKFFKAKILDRFYDDSYVFDVWWRGHNKVTLIDFNPFSCVTDGLLFSWSELETLSVKADVKLETRCIENESGISSGPYQRYAMPVDLFDLTTGNDISKFVDLINLHDNGIQNADTDSD